MTMVKRNRLRSARPKALFGIDGGIEAAATLGAAAINAGATAAAAAVNAKAIKENAKEQAESIKANAEARAEALQQQNENSNKLQKDMIAFNKQQNEETRRIMENMQMQLQIQAGNQNHIQMQEAAKARYKCGGSMRRRLRNGSIGMQSSSLRGRYDNLPFTVTDGGGVIPMGSTPEGYDLYEIVGNDHEHYHKAQGGRNKTGVGIRFINGETIEGEGNQNSSQGEFMLVTPNDAKFISKHSIKGYNPAKAVMAGVHPLDAFNQQETLKDVYGISDDGKSYSSTPLRSMRYYGGNDNTNLQFLTPVNNILDREEARCGRSLRRKAAYGDHIPSSSYIPGLGMIIPYEYLPYQRDFTLKGLDTHNKVWQEPINMNPISYDNSGGLKQSSASGSYYPTDIAGNSYGTTKQGLSPTAKANLWGAGITAVGNLIGAGITNWGNNKAAGIITAGNTEAADILADAYGRLGTVDMNLLDRRDYRAAHAMAALQAPIVNDGALRAAAERSRDRMNQRIARNTLSSAAALNRMARNEDNYNQVISGIDENTYNKKQDITQGNMNRITTVSEGNANRDTQALHEFGRDRLGLLQYNNDIENQKIIGAAQARADAITQNALTLGTTKQSNANTWANTISGIGGTFGNTLATNGKMAHELEMSRFGWTAENNLNWVIRTGDINEAKLLYNRYKGLDGQYAIWAKQLESAFGKNRLNS